MSDEDRRRWEERYGRSAAPPGPPSRFVADWLEKYSGQPGRALDAACGTGRNALALALHGWQVDAVDVSAAALARGRRAAAEGLPGGGIHWIEADLDDWPVTAAAYDLVVVSRFLDRRLAPALAGALHPGGHLLYEQHFVTERPVGGPRSARFRLARGELPKLFAGLETIDYREDFEPAPDGTPLALARLVARRSRCGCERPRSTSLGGEPDETSSRPACAPARA